MADIGKLTARDLVVISDDGEPRMRDVRLGGRLEYGGDKTSRHGDAWRGGAERIRRLIERNADELQDYGTLARREVKSTGGREATEYWLNEGQAILVCFLSRAQNARPIRREVIHAFLAFRRGERPATPLIDALFAPPAPTIERDDNILHVTHEDWKQSTLFDAPQSRATRKPPSQKLSHPEQISEANERHLAALVGDTMKMRWSEHIEQDICERGVPFAKWPVGLKRMWWQETDFNRKPVSAQFLAKMRSLLDVALSTRSSGSQFFGYEDDSARDIENDVPQPGGN